MAILTRKESSAAEAFFNFKNRKSIAAVRRRLIELTKRSPEKVVRFASLVGPGEPEADRMLQVLTRLAENVMRRRQNLGVKPI